MKPFVVENLTPEDFEHPDLHRCAKAIGVAATLRLIEVFGGSNVYFGKRVDNGVIAAFLSSPQADELTVKEKATALGVTRSTVYKAMEKPLRKPRAPRPLQTSLFNSP